MAKLIRGVAFFCMLAVGLAAHAGDPFDPANRIDAPAIDDPFGPGNKADAAPPKTDPVKTPPNPEDRIGKALQKLIDIKATISPEQAKPGEVVKLTIAGTLKPHFHTYPVTQRTPNQSMDQLTRIEFENVPGLKPLAPVTESPPQPYRPNVGGVVEEFWDHENQVTWSQDILVLPDAAPGQKTLPIRIWLQVCDNKGCTGPNYYPPLAVALNVEPGAAGPLTQEMQNRLTAKQEIKVVPLPGSLPTVAPTAKIEPPSPSADGSLLGMLVPTMLSAIGMLLTPCVFPMIPITVSFFLKQSENKQNNALAMAGVYSITIIVVLALAVLLLGKLIINLANSPWLNLGLGAVLTFFALSLFGMYEIELPTFLSNFTSSREGQGGYAGAFFMALTFTITSFTCTGPFLGPLLVATKELRLSLPQLVFAAFVYSTTFAAPFFLLALFPRLLKSLPKSGGWLNNVKVVMGFLELAAALKFLGNTDAAWNPGNPQLFNYETILCAWIALSLACGAYLLGFFRLPHDDAIESIGVGRMLFASLFIGLGVYMAPALIREVPQGAIGRGVVAFLPQDTKVRSPGSEKGQAHLDWLLDYQTAWEQAVREDKLIFIDFTGVNCTNCRDNELRVFPRKEVRQGLEKYVRVQLYTDTVPKPGLSSAEAKAQASRNQGLQDTTFSNITNPFYAIVRPAKDKPIEDGKIKGDQLETWAGIITDSEIDKFVNKLNAPLKAQLALANSPK